MSARTVGLFYACPEAGVAWRGAGIVRVSDVLEEVRVQRASEVGGKERKGRRMQVRVSVAGEVGQGEWGAIEGDAGVESVLRGRGKAVFAEELFGLVRPLSFRFEFTVLRSERRSRTRLRMIRYSRRGSCWGKGARVTRS
jgi:hypothetical protein